MSTIRNIEINVEEMNRQVAQLEKFIKIEENKEKKALLLGMAGMCVILLHGYSKPQPTA